MFCQNCGKQIGENDNFCRYCGADLKSDIVESEDDIEKFFEEQQKDEDVDEDFQYSGEELVLYDVKKHWMSLFWPAFLTPLFLIYFWTSFLSSHSLFSWVIFLGMLGLIIYPVARFKSDKIIVTTKSVHIKMGILNPVEFEIPLEKSDIMDVKQTSMGRMLDYGTISFCLKSEKYDYPYIDSPEDFQYILENPKRFLKESLEEN